MTAVILAALALWFIQSLIPASIIGGRAQRAFRNLVVFLTLALLLEIAGDVEPLAVQAGWAFIGLRVLYVPAYLSAIKGLRSAVWMLAVAALGVMGWTLL